LRKSIQQTKYFGSYKLFIKVFKSVGNLLIIRRRKTCL